MSDLSRRTLFGAAGVGGAAAGALAVAMAAAPEAPVAPASQGSRAYPYFGAHQGGIVTPAQDRMHFAAFDAAEGLDREALIGLLRDWTDAAARMTQGGSAGELDAMSGSYDAPPQDTGEAYDLPPAGLTVTFGFGPGLFGDAKGNDRFGIADRRPAALVRLPHFVADNLDPALSDGDLCIQACADDPQVAVHAIRNLTRIAFGRAVLRWSQLGFGRTSSTSVEQATPRNLFGFKDGTMGLRGEQRSLIDEHVWVREGADPAAAWLEGGSYLVARKIRMQIETWDRAPMREQETIVGRTKREGAPLAGGGEFDQPDFALQGRGGVPVVDPASHVAITHPDHNDGVQLLRRGYNYVDGNDDLGRLSAGLFFIAYVSDPRTHYIPMQSRLSRSDLMMEYLQHIGSGLWAVPPGVAEGGFVGEALFAKVG